jgi:adenylate cyclase
MLVSALIAMVFITLFFGSREDRIDSILVLPFENMSGDAEQDLLCEMLTTELTSELNHVGAIRVVSNRTARTYESSEKSLSEIASEQGVKAVVEGSVSRTGGKVTVTAWLSRADPEEQLWSDTYDRGIGELTNLRRELTRTIVNEISVTLTPAEASVLAASRPPADDVFREYQLATQFAGQMYESGQVWSVAMQAAIPHFERAIAMDSTFAPAWAGLADMLAWFCRWRMTEDRDELIARARYAAQRAFELDPDNPEVYEALSTLAILDLDLERGVRQAERALELDPTPERLSYHASSTLVWEGRFEEGIEIHRQILEREPVAEWAHDGLAWLLIVARRHEEAIAKIEENKALFANYNDHMLPWCYEDMGDYENAARLYREHEIDPGYRDRASWRVAMIDSVAIDSTRCVEDGLGNYRAYEIARAYAGLGYADPAVGWLELAVEAVPVDLMQINTDSPFDVLRPDPRFQAIMERMGIPSGDLAALDKR